MSTNARVAVAKLEQKYARVFGVDIELIKSTWLPDDNWQVHCPSRPELPVWTTGEMP